MPEALINNFNDFFLQIWHSLASGILGQTKEAINTISKIKHRSDLSLLVIICKICVYESSPNQHADIIIQLKNGIDDLTQNSNHFCLTQSMQVAIMFRNFNLALPIRKYLKKQSSIKGWLKLFLKEYQSAEKIFDSVLKIEKNDVLAYFGQYILYLLTNQQSKSLDIYGNITIMYNFPGINIEKARYVSQH